MDIANRLRGRSDPEKSHAPQNINEARRMWEAKERAKDEEARRKAEKKTEKKASKEEKRGRKSTTSIGSFGGGRRKTDKDGRVTSSMFGDLAAQDRAEQAARESAMNSRDGVPPGQHDYFAMYARERLGGDFAPGAFIDTDSSYHPAINLNDSTAPLGERQGTFSAEGNEKAGRRGSPRTQAAKEKLYQTKQKGKSFWARFWIWLQLRVIKFERKTTREIYERQARDKARKEQIEATERKERERVERLRVERDQRERARAAMAG